jgi:O-antigen/teichoic acid export membrane protein
MIPNSVLRGLLSGLQLYRSLMLVNLVTSPIWAAACVLVLLKGGGITGVLLATLAVEFLNLGAFVWQARRVVIDWRSPLPEALRLRLRRYNLTLAGLILLEAIVWQRSELLFLGRFQPSEQVSFYALPFALTERLMELIPGALLGVLLPGLTFAQATGDSRRFRAVFGEALRYLILLTVPLCILGILVAPVIVSALYGGGFAPAAIVLQILLVAVVFSVLAQASRSALLGMEAQGRLLKTGVIAAAASIALDLLLIPRWGAIGAAIANATVQAGWALALFLPLAAHLRKRSDGPGQEKASVDLPLGVRLKGELEHRA